MKKSKFCEHVNKKLKVPVAECDLCTFEALEKAEAEALAKGPSAKKRIKKEK